jgi:DNA-binding beta-propeller fold protein YncE
MRLGLIGGTDSKRTSGVYQPEDVVALQDAKKYLTRFGYDGVFNALTSSGVEEGFDVSRDGRYVYVAVRGTRLTATIFQYECSTPWDLATITYSSKSLVVGDYELNCNGIAISDDGTRLFFTGYGGDTIWSCTLSTPYDLATATVDVKKFYVGGQDATPNTPFFGDSGTKMYVMGNTSDTVYQYTLSTAWDVSTATYASKSLSVTTMDATPEGLFFRDNGTKLYVIGSTRDIVFSYTLSTAWDIATATSDYVQKSISVNTQSTVSWEVRFSSDGTKMYVLNGLAAVTDTVFQYTLSTAWDVSTATYASKSFSVNTQENSATGMDFKDDGTKMYIVGQTNDTVYQYSLSTAWDISTASYDSISKSVAAQELTPTGLFFGNSGAKMYVIGSAGDDINEYDLSTAWDVSTASFVRVSATVGDTGPNSLFFSSDGTKLAVLGGSADAIRYFTLSTAWNVSTISFVGAYPVTHFGSLATGIAFKTDGTEVYVVDQTSANNRVYQMSLATAWNPLSVANRYYVGNEETVPSALFFKPDGTKMFVIGTNGDDVNEYNLSTAWDVTAASFVSVSAVVGEASPNGLWFKDDGTKMYVTGATNDAVREFTLSTAWDVSTISFVQSLSIGFETVPTGVTFKDDGTELYVLGSTNDTVFEIQLGTAWNISTAEGFVYVGGTETIPRGIHINSDGTLLFLAGSGSNNIRKYTLSTAYAVETATLSQSFALTGVHGVHIFADGLKILATVNDVAGQTPAGGRAVRQITLTSPNDLATASKSDVEIIPLYGLTGTSADPWGVRVSPDGTRMFVLSDVVQGLYQFSLRFA